eukprot:snap_masked-scaffold48_size466083-processed-gene-2.5 protein:Tk05980 transcript:snap_masked-scaffold48_size466083-processed-gene-2.5-mRNA-1 annotation:"fork head domain-containing protein fd5"
MSAVGALTSGNPPSCVVSSALRRSLDLTMPPIISPPVTGNPALVKPVAQSFPMVGSRNTSPIQTTSASGHTPMAQGLPSSLMNLPLPGNGGQAVPPNLDHIRLQQLYTLALADRMRFIHPLLGGPGGVGGPHLPSMPTQPRGFPSPGGLPPPDFHHPLYPYGKFDPRLFRLPEEPKPQHSYIGLIAMAILSVPDKKLVLADIYQYILDNFSYFRHRGPGWRNSIRHNLSLNDCFIKAGRAANGKGHYWAIHPACVDDFARGDYRRRKAQRKVRRHMGLAVDEEDSPSPPPPMHPMSTASLLPNGWPPLFHHPLASQNLLPHPQRHIPILQTPIAPCTETFQSRKRQFDVASLLDHGSASPHQSNEDKKEEEANRSPPPTSKFKFNLGGPLMFSPTHSNPISEEDRNPETDEEREVKGEDVDVVSVGAPDDKSIHSDDSIAAPASPPSTKKEPEDEDSRQIQDGPKSSPLFGGAFRPASGFPWAPILNPLSAQMENQPTSINPQEYLARYYQLMQQNASSAMARSMEQSPPGSKSEQTARAD